MYNKVYPFTLDLYKLSVKQEDILKFNKEYDKLTIAVKKENKQATLQVLSNLFDELQIFMDKCSNNEKDKAIIKTKSYIFKAYSVLDAENWSIIDNNINKAIQEFTKIVTDITNTKKTNQYGINKAYIMLNELANSIELKDKDVFLIKYKNVLEELQNL